MVGTRYLFARHAGLTPGSCYGAAESASDFCNGRAHMAGSLACAHGEAKLLHRTLVVPDRVCCSSAHCHPSRCANTTTVFALAGVALESQVAIAPSLVGCSETTTSLSQTPLAGLEAVQFERGCQSFLYERCLPESAHLNGGFRPDPDHAPFGMPKPLAIASNKIKLELRAAAERAQTRAR